MLLLEADCHTGVLSGGCKIKKKKKVAFHYTSVLSKLSITWKKKKKSCFQFYFSPFKTFFIGIMNVQDSSLQRKERCRVYYPNVNLNKWLFYGVFLGDATLDQRGGLPSQPRGKELPEMS